MIRPLTGYVVSPDAAPRVAAPVVEDMSEDERRAIVEANPESSVELLYEAPVTRDTARHYLARVTSDGTFQPTSDYWLYRVSKAGHQQVGIVAEIEVASYGKGRLRPHENTRHEVAEAVADAHQEIGATTHPISLTYRHDDPIDELVAEVVSSPPALDLSTPDGRRQEAWPYPDSKALSAALANIDVLYIADGHHRTAGKAVLAQRLSAGPNQPAGRLLAVLFPDNQMQILGYHRYLHMPDKSPEAVSEALSRQFDVRPISLAQTGSVKQGDLCFFAGGEWHELTFRPEEHLGPAAALDASMLQSQVLGPICDVVDPRTDPRLNYLPGIVDLSELAETCRDQQAVGFVTRPPTIADVMTVADSGNVMPPKSTWFSPKVGAGIFLRRVI